MDDEFQELEKANAAARQAQDREDHNNALAGNFDTGRRINRGFRDKHVRDENTRKREKRSLSQALKMSARYARQYQATMDNFHKTANAVYEAQVAASLRVSEAEAALQMTLDAASTLPDGTEVFRSKDGTVYAKDGREVEGDELASVTWHDDAFPWESYQAQVAELQDAQQFLNRMDSHAERLFELETELKDESNLVSGSRMTEINDEFEAIHNEAAGSNIRANLKITELTPSLDATVKFDF